MTTLNPPSTSSPPMGFCVLEGPDHVYTLASEGYYDLLGGRRNLIGKPAREALPELVDQGFVELLDRVYETGQPWVARETPIEFATDRGPRKLFVDFVYQPKLNREGRVDSIVFVSTDVTAQVKSRLQLEALADELQAAVSTRDEFMSIVSHELKNPITSLKLNLQVTRMRLGAEKIEAGDSEKMARSIESSSRQVERLTTLIDDLLDLTRIRNGRLRCDFAALDAGKLLRDVVERFDEQLRQAGCECTVAAQGDLRATWDRVRIEQVVVNLLSNVIKYAPRAPVRIRVQAGENGPIRIEVQDGGPGIPPERQEAIFERFERGTRSRSINGLGLGLYIAREIVKAHEGTIHVQNAETGGAIFVIQLPRDPGATHTA